MRMQAIRVAVVDGGTVGGWVKSRPGGCLCKGDLEDEWGEIE